MERAMSRIEAALARIEQATAKSTPSSGDGWDAHRLLKARVGGVLSELDKLIGELER